MKLFIITHFLQKHLTCFRTATARGKAEQADEAADQAKEDCDIAQATAKQFAPDFKHPGFDRIGLREKYRQKVYDAQQKVAATVSQESEKILDGKSIPNHIPPMHSQIPQNNRAPNAVPSRRPSTQYPKAVDPRLPNSSNYSADNRNLGPAQDPYYSSNQDNWKSANTTPQISPDSQKSYLPNDQTNLYGPVSQGSQQQQQQQQPSSYRFNQPSMDQSGQQYVNQDRRLSSTNRPQPNQRNQQNEWNPPQAPPRRQSILGQPSYDAQGNAYIDSGPSAYGRNELRTGTVHSEGPLDRQAMPTSQQPYRPTTDSQGYRQPHDQQAYGQPQDHMYRQMPNDNQAYRQQGSADQGYRPSAPSEQDTVNGARAPGQRPSIDYFDHYKRPPSRDSSVDRYGRRSRQPSVEAAPSGGSRAGSVAPQPAMPSRPASRAATPAGNGHLASGRGSISSRAGSREQPFEDSLLRKRTLGQEISPSPYQPKRTESLYVAPVPDPPPPAPMRGGGGGGGGGGRKVG